MPTEVSNTIAIVGISPRNSFFNKANIAWALRETLSEYRHVAVMIPDVPAVSTWLALGYVENKARQKARLDGNRYRNSVESICVENSFSADRVSIVWWQGQVQQNPHYLASYIKVHQLYELSVSFREAARKTTAGALKSARLWNGQRHEIVDMDKATDIAVNYVLSELAFIDAAPRIFDIQKADYIYHREFEIYDQYRKGEFDGVPRPHLGMRILGRD